MTFLDEVKILLKSFTYWILSFIGFSFFFLIFGLRKIAIFGEPYYFLAPTENSFSVQVFNKVRDDLLPPGVQLVTTNPMSAFVSQILLSMLLSFLLTTPFLMYRIIMYLRPELLFHEQKAVVWSLLPLVLLFFTGSMFSYFFHPLLRRCNDPTFE